VLQCAAVRCSVLQRGAVCCRVLQCVAGNGRTWHKLAQERPLAVCCSVLQCVAVPCSVLQCVAACCSVLQSIGLQFSVMQAGNGETVHELARQRHSLALRR